MRNTDTKVHKRRPSANDPAALCRTRSCRKLRRNGTKVSARSGSSGESPVFPERTLGYSETYLYSDARLEISGYSTSPTLSLARTILDQGNLYKVSGRAYN